MKKTFIYLFLLLALFAALPETDWAQVSDATAFRIRRLSKNPVRCTQGDIYYNTGNNEMRVCVVTGAPGTWQQIGAGGGGGSGGVTDHGFLSGLGDDDHTQYFTTARGDARYNTKTEITNFLSGKQNTLVSGTNLKTINGNSLLGSGDLVISGGGVASSTFAGLPSGASIGTIYSVTDNLRGLWRKTASAGWTPLDKCANVTDFGAIPDDATDDTASFNAAIAYVVSTMNGGCVYAPAGTYDVSELQTPGISLSSASLIPVEIVGAAHPSLLFGTVPAPTFPAHTKGTIIKSSSGTGGGVIRVIQDPAPPNPTFPFSFVHLIVRDLTVRTYQNPQKAGIDARWAQQLTVERVTVDNGVYNANAVEPTNAAAIGIMTPFINNGAYIYIDQVSVSGYWTGIELNEHSYIGTANVTSNKWGLDFRDAFHASQINRIGTYRNQCNIHMSGTGGHAFTISQMNTEQDNATTHPELFDSSTLWQQKLYDICDSGNKLIGEIKWNLVEGGEGRQFSFTKNGATGVSTSYIGESTSGDFVPMLNFSNSLYGAIDITTADKQGGFVFQRNAANKWMFGMNFDADATDDFFLFDAAALKARLYIPKTGATSGSVNLGGDAYTEPAVSILDNKNVGINKLEPTKKLDIEFSSTAPNDGIQITNTSSDAGAGVGIGLTNHAGTVAGLRLYSESFGLGLGGNMANVAGKSLLLVSDGGVLNGGSNSIQLRTGGYDTTQERMRILGNGRVGIGTPIPDSLFEINFGANAGKFNFDNPSTIPVFRINNTNPTTGGAIGGLIDWQHLGVNQFRMGTDFSGSGVRNWYVHDQVAGGDAGIMLHASGNFSINNVVDSGFRFDVTGTGRFSGAVNLTALNLDRTITAGGITGAATINKMAGTINIAAGQTSIVLTNNLVNADSLLNPQVRCNDSTMKSVAYVAVSGSVTFYPNAAPASECSIGWKVEN